MTARRTYYDLVAERFVDMDLPSFNDVQGSVRWDAGGGRWLSVSGIRSREDTDATFDDDDTQEHGDFVTRARNDLVSGRFHAPFGGQFTSDTVAAWYENIDLLDVNALVQNTSQRTNAPGDGAFGRADVIFDRTISVRDLSLRERRRLAGRPAHGRGRRRAARPGHPRRVRRSAATATRRRATARARPAAPACRTRSTRRSTRPGRRLAAGPRAGHGGPDASSPASASTGATSTGGRRSRRAWPRRCASTPPRRLRAAGGLFTQSPGYEKLIQSDYLIDLSDGRALDLDSERAVHAILGIERDLAPGTPLRAEAYWKRFDRLIVGGLETEEELVARVAPTTSRRSTRTASPPSRS